MLNNVSYNCNIILYFTFYIKFLFIEQECVRVFEKGLIEIIEIHTKTFVPQ